MREEKLNQRKRKRREEEKKKIGVRGTRWGRKGDTMGKIKRKEGNYMTIETEIEASIAKF